LVPPSFITLPDWLFDVRVPSRGNSFLRQYFTFPRCFTLLALNKNWVQQQGELQRVFDSAPHNVFNWPNFANPAGVMS
jgi:hypothetical protein